MLLQIGRLTIRILDRIARVNHHPLSNVNADMGARLGRVICASEKHKIPRPRVLPRDHRAAVINSRRGCPIDPTFIKLPASAKTIIQFDNSIEFIADNVIYYIIDGVGFDCKSTEELICGIFQ